MDGWVESLFRPESEGYRATKVLRDCLLAECIGPARVFTLWRWDLFLQIMTFNGCLPGSR